MSFARGKASISVAATTITLGACSVFEPSDNFSAMAEVTPVVTEHSFGLQCLGSIIDDSRLAPILVSVDRIRDRTIPDRLNDEARLSQAGEWLVHTAISKLETTQVRSILDDDDRDSVITLSGAWTQDDELVSRSGGLFEFEWLRGRLGLNGRQSYDYIAGDFVTSQDGVVVFSTAIGVMLGSKRAEARLFVDNGDESAEIGFEGRWADGPQLAQRRIAEAATLIHIANFYNIDYRPCLESGWGDPATFRSSLERYALLSEHDRNMAAQRRLATLGHGPLAIDGRWGDDSRRALIAYQAERRLPPTGKLSSVVFALLDADRS